MRKALFLDRDGVLIEDRHYLRDPNQVCLIPGVKEALADAIRLGALLFLLTNQSGVGRGSLSMEDVHACNQRMLELLNLPEPGLTAIKIAPEKPEQPQLYRKPSPRFILEMIAVHRLEPKGCFMIGDRETDIRAGWNAGIFSIAVRTGKPFSEVMEAMVLNKQLSAFSSLADWMATEGKLALARAV